MNVFIITEGNPNIGFGHIIRCISIYQGFQHFGIDPLFIINGCEKAKELLEDKRAIFFNWLENSDLLFNKINNSDIVIIDSYLSDIEIYKSISEITKLPVYIDDNKRLNFPKGIIVNTLINAFDLNYENNLNEFLFGSDYAILRKEFWIQKNHLIRKNIEQIMLIFGGSDIRNLTPKILNLLNKNYPYLIKNVIVGKGYINKEEINLYKTERNNIFYSPTTSEIRSIMHSSDLAISAGGQTIYELAVTGLPSIILGVADNQINSISNWKNKNSIKYAGYYTDEDLEVNIIKLIEFYQNKNNRLEISQRLQKLVDGQGTKKIITYLLDKLKS